MLGIAYGIGFGWLLNCSCGFRVHQQRGISEAWTNRWVRGEFHPFRGNTENSSGGRRVEVVVGIVEDQVDFRRVGFQWLRRKIIAAVKLKRGSDMATAAIGLHTSGSNNNRNDGDRCIMGIPAIFSALNHHLPFREGRRLWGLVRGRRPLGHHLDRMRGGATSEGTDDALYLIRLVAGVGYV